MHLNLSAYVRGGGQFVTLSLAEVRHAAELRYANNDPTPRDLSRHAPCYDRRTLWHTHGLHAADPGYE